MSLGPEKIRECPGRTGCFADYIVLPMSNVWHHDEAIDRDVACIFDPFGNSVHTALSFPLLGEDILVTGAGPIGIMAAAVAVHAGARYTVITDVNPYRLDLARKLGVTLAVDVSRAGASGDDAPRGAHDRPVSPRLSRDCAGCGSARRHLHTADV